MKVVQPLRAEASPLHFQGETYPLSRATALKLALELLAGGNVVIIVIQTFPQLISGIPTRLSLCRVWSRHHSLKNTVIRNGNNSCKKNEITFNLSPDYYCMFFYSSQQNMNTRK